MKKTRTVVGLMSLVLVLALPVLLQGQKAGKPPSDPPSTVPIPLKVTFYAEDGGGSTALRGHPGTGDVTYEDRTGGIDAYISKEGNLWFHIDCRYGNHIDLDLLEQNHVDTGDDEPIPYAEGDMQTFRITTWTASGRPGRFGDMQPGETYPNHSIGIQFWTRVDQYAWNLQYDGIPDQSDMTANSVNIAVSLNASGKRTWTLTPTPTPQHLGPAEMLFEKRYPLKPRGVASLHYGTWRMPFKIVLEQIQ